MNDKKKERTNERNNMLKYVSLFLCLSFTLSIHLSVCVCTLWIDQSYYYITTIHIGMDYCCILCCLFPVRYMCVCVFWVSVKNQSTYVLLHITIYIVAHFVQTRTTHLFLIEHNFSIKLNQLRISFDFKWLWNNQTHTHT